ncbi:MAG: sigma-70 family RNA polymerase sigma factor [Bacteroidota bacterium]
MSVKKTDKEIWKAIVSGQEDGLTELFFRYGDMMMGYGISLCTKKELVKDCIQEVFLDIWRRKEKLPKVESVKYYLLTALRRQIFRSLKQDIRNLKREYSLEDFETASFEEVQIEQEQQTFRRKNLLTQILHLPERQREIIYLRFYQGFSHDEICQIMQIKKQAAWNLLSRAIKKLEVLMKNSPKTLPLLYFAQLFSN